VSAEPLEFWRGWRVAPHNETILHVQALPGVCVALSNGVSIVNLALLLITVKVEPTLELSSEIYKTLMA